MLRRAGGAVPLGVAAVCSDCTVAVNGCDADPCVRSTIQSQLCTKPVTFAAVSTTPLPSLIARPPTTYIQRPVESIAKPQLVEPRPPSTCGVLPAVGCSAKTSKSYAGTLPPRRFMV